MKTGIFAFLFGILYLSGSAFSSCYDIQDACYQRCCGDNVGSWEILADIGVGEGECDSTSYCARVGRWGCLMQTGAGSRDSFYSCARSCIASNGCGGDWIGDGGGTTQGGGTTAPPTSGASTPSEPSCESEQIGTFETVTGSPKVTRGGEQFTATVGGKYCLNDEIKTAAGEKVIIDFGDGNKRLISNGGWMQIMAAEGESAFLTNAYGVMETLTSYETPEAMHTVVIGCRLPSPGSCDMEVAYIPHSYLRCEFGSDGDRITVIEGQLEVIDTRSGESAFVDSGYEYYRMAGESAQEGRTRVVDLSSVPQEMRGGGDCCGTAFILMLVPLLAFIHRS